MVAVGIGVGFIMLMTEILYSKYQGEKEKQNDIAKKAVARWKRYVQVEARNLLLSEIILIKLCFYSIFIYIEKMNMIQVIIL